MNDFGLGSDLIICKNEAYDTRLKRGKKKHKQVGYRNFDMKRNMRKHTKGQKVAQVVDHNFLTYLILTFNHSLSLIKKKQKHL